MPLYPFPNIPNYPGVPQLLRPVSAAIASTPVLALGIGELQTVLANVSQQAPQWGIFDTNGDALGDTSFGASLNSIVSAVLSQQQAVLSTVSFVYSKESRISDFPVEDGGFATYNKVQVPVNPVVTLALDGSVSDRTTFLNALDAACDSTDLYNIVTPEITYVGYSIERISYDRSALRGVTLFPVDITLKEIRQVSAAFTQVTTPINTPQNASATPVVNNGKVQAATPDVSTLKSITNYFGITN